MRGLVTRFWRLSVACLLGAYTLTVPSSSQSIGGSLPDQPEAHSPLTLKAVTNAKSGRSAFSYAGREIPPVIRAFPGDQIRLDYLNRMTTASHEICVDGPCSNMTNLHFHGLHVSPKSPQDDVISMMAMPGESLQYIVDIPADQPPGLY